MKIGNFQVKISIITIGVFVFFTIFLIIASLFSPEVRINLVWMVPCLFLLLVIPAGLNLISRSQYADIAPVYEAEAKTIRIRLINASMIGKPVRIEGVVEKVNYQFLNRPQYLVADRTGSISVKMFTSPDVDVKVDDIVEVYGQVIQRYIVTGDPIINCVSIKKIKK